MGFEVVGVNTLEVTASNAFNVSELQGYINDTSITMIRFFDGSYSISQPLIVSRGNLEIVGESQSGVILNYTGTTAGSTLKVESGAPLLDPDLHLTNSVSVDSDTISLQSITYFVLDANGDRTSDGSGGFVTDDLKAGNTGDGDGDTLYLFEPNDDVYLDDDNAAPIRWFDNGGQSGETYDFDDKNGNGVHDAGENYFPDNKRPLREFHSVITEITEVDEDSDGTTDYWDVKLADETPYAFSNAASVVRASDLVAGVEISNITFTNDSPTLLNIQDYYTEPATGWNSVATLDLNGTLNATVENVTITLPKSHGVSVDRSYGATLTNVRVEGAQSRTGGNGYHFELQEAFNTTATHLESVDYISAGVNYGGARHSLLFSSYHAEHYNHIHFDKVTRDINFHGSIDTDNYVVIDAFDYSSLPATLHITPNPPHFPVVSGEVYAELADSWNPIHRSIADHHPHEINPDADGNSVADIFETYNKVWVVKQFDGGPNADFIAGMPSADVTALRDPLKSAVENEQGEIDNDLIVNGGDGNDLIFGADGDDTINGDDGNDKLLGHDGDDDLKGGNGDDKIWGDEDNDRLEGGDGDDQLYGGSGNDFIWGASENSNDHGHDYISGFDGDDWLYGSNGRGLLYGGEGNDYLNGGHDSGTADVDQLWGGPGNDTLVSGQGAVNQGYEHNGDQLFGEDGNDILTGGQANDVLMGGSGTDIIEGGVGDDVLWAASDTANAYGLDTLRGGDGNDTLRGSNGRNKLYGDSGNDLIYGGNDGNTADIDKLYGGEGNDTLISQQGSVATLHVQNGDFLYGEAGDDILLGGQANDTLVGGTGADALDGGAGIDAVTYAASASAVKVNLSNGTGQDGDAAGDVLSNIENVYGSDHNDTITGNGDANALYGRDGDDQMHGSHSDDFLDGGDGDDYLRGLNGNDTLSGGKGNDTLIGGNGDDVFVFDQAYGPNNIDEIEDFEQAGDADILHIKASVFGGGLVAGGLSSGQFMSGTSAGDANDRFIFDQSTGKLWFDADGTGAGAQFLIAEFTNGATVQSDDVFVV